MSFDSLPSVSVSQLISCLYSNRCYRQIALQARAFETPNRRSTWKAGSTTGKPITTLDSGLAATGAAWEHDVEAMLHAAGLQQVACMAEATATGSRQAVRHRAAVEQVLEIFMSARPGCGMYAAEVDMALPPSRHMLSMHGRADFMVLIWQESEPGCPNSHLHLHPVVLLLECKASHEVQDHHKLQAACYAYMLEQTLQGMATGDSDAPAVLWSRRATVKCAVLVQGQHDKWSDLLDVSQHPSTWLASTPRNSMLHDEEVVKLTHRIRTALAPDSELAVALQTGYQSTTHDLSDPGLPLKKVSYAYGSHCVGCPVAAACLEAASTGRGELQLAGCSASMARALAEGRVLEDIEDLAAASDEVLQVEAVRIAQGEVQLRRLRQVARLRRTQLEGQRAGATVLAQAELLLLPGPTSLPPAQHEAGSQTMLLHAFILPVLDLQTGRAAGVAALVSRNNSWHSGERVLDLVSCPWHSSGKAPSPEAAFADSAAERQMLEAFSCGLRDAMVGAAGGEDVGVRIHFYFLTRGHATTLLARCCALSLDEVQHGAGGPLHELSNVLESALNARGAIEEEQPLISFLAEEMRSRFVTSWLGSDLATMLHAHWPDAPPVPEDVLWALQPLSSLHFNGGEAVQQLAVQYSSHAIPTSYWETHWEELQEGGAFTSLEQLVTAHVQAMAWLECAMRTAAHAAATSLWRTPDLQAEAEAAAFIPRALREKSLLCVRQLFDSALCAARPLGGQDAWQLMGAAADVVQLEAAAGMDRWFREMLSDRPPAVRVLDGGGCLAAAIVRQGELDQRDHLVVQLHTDGNSDEAFAASGLAIGCTVRVSALQHPHNPDTHLSHPQPLSYWHEEVGGDTRSWCVMAVVSKVQHVTWPQDGTSHALTRSVHASTSRAGQTPSAANSAAVWVTLKLNPMYMFKRTSPQPTLARHLLPGAASFSHLRQAPGGYIMMDPSPDIGGWVAGRVLQQLRKGPHELPAARVWLRLLAQCVPGPADEQHVAHELAGAIAALNLSAISSVQRSSDKVGRAALEPAPSTPVRTGLLRGHATPATGTPATPARTTARTAVAAATAELGPSTSSAYIPRKGSNTTAASSTSPEADSLPAALEECVQRLYVQYLTTRCVAGDVSGEAAARQFAAVAEGWRQGAALQLMQGPPGTGKTEASAIAVLTYSSALMQHQVRSRGAHGVRLLLVSANTNASVENIMRRIRDRLNLLEHDGSPLSVAHLHKHLYLLQSSSRGPGNSDGTALGGEGDAIVCCTNPTLVGENPFMAPAVRAAGVPEIRVVGGSVTQLLKFADAAYKKDRLLPASFLLADEGSQMPFSHLLALITLLTPPATAGPAGQGRTGPDLCEACTAPGGAALLPPAYVLVAGDHRQLPAVNGHKWELETRPCATRWRAHLSAHDFLHQASGRGGLVARSQLAFTLRLPPLLRQLIATLYANDGVLLTGQSLAVHTAPCHLPPAQPSDTDWAAGIWSGRGGGVFVVRHAEAGSTKLNRREVRLVTDVLHAMPATEREAVRSAVERGGKGCVVISPHRAQCAALRDALRAQGLADLVSVVDTVDSMQGDEARTVIYSATASDVATLSSNPDFYLTAARANVAFSRAQARLVVVASDSFLAYTATQATSAHSDGMALWQQLQQMVRLEDAAAGPIAALASGVLVCGQYHP